MTLFFAALFTAVSLCAEMPQKVQGVWIVDAEASSKNLRTSPKWDESSEKSLPMLMKMISKMALVFDAESMKLLMPKREMKLPMKLKSSEESQFVFDASAQGKTFQVTISLRTDGVMNMKSTGSDDMDYFLWKKVDKAPDLNISDSALAMEMIATAMSADKKQEDTQKSKTPKVDKVKQYAQLMKRVGTATAIYFSDGIARSYPSEEVMKKEFLRDFTGENEGLPVVFHVKPGAVYGGSSTTKVASLEIDGKSFFVFEDGHVEVK
jgi:hypothetical protein